ncbi:kinase-like protein [Ceratobasidium sp. AG-I]|nr:kinase-like protein [Ceratobasidium sp. AG-I]
MPENEARAQASLDTQCAMSLADVVLELAPTPIISSMMGCLTIVFQAVEKTKVNRMQWELLRGRCVMVTRLAGAQVTNHGGAAYPGLQNSAKILRETITNIGHRAAYYNNMHEIFALFQYQSISEEIRSHFAQLDVCLRLFSYASDVAQMQWIGEFSAIQRAELCELEGKKKLVVGHSGNLDVTGKTNEQVEEMASQMDESLQKVLEDSFEAPQIQGATTLATFANEQKIVENFLSLTGLQLPPQIILGRQCILEANAPIRAGTTCDIYTAAFLGGEKVAKKMFRIGMSEKAHMRKYAERFLDNAKLWATFRSDYILPFYGVGTEGLEGDGHFQLYMVSPLMKNFDAGTYLKEYKSNPDIKQQIMRIITDTARGLQYLHKREPPVIHSNIRGDNILITDSGRAILGGFTYAQTLQNSSDEGVDTLPAIVTTVTNDSHRWMAPEMFESDLPVLQLPSDIWGWAMATLEVISGLPPYFQCKQPHTLVHRIGSGKRPLRQDHVDFNEYALQPNSLWELLEKCWAFEPSDRPTIDDVVTDLERMVAMPVTEHEDTLENLSDVPDIPEVFVVNDRTSPGEQEAEAHVAKQMLAHVTEAVALSMLQPLASRWSSDPTESSNSVTGVSVSRVSERVRQQMFGLGGPGSIASTEVTYVTAPEPSPTQT